MDENVLFLNFEGLDDYQVRDLRNLLHPSNGCYEVEFPWSSIGMQKGPLMGNNSTLNVHAPVFESYTLKNDIQCGERPTPYSLESTKTFVTSSQRVLPAPFPYRGEKNKSKQNELESCRTNAPLTNGNSLNSKVNEPSSSFKSAVDATHDSTFDPDSAQFKLNPTVSCFVPTGLSPPQTNGTGFKPRTSPTQSRVLDDNKNGDEGKKNTTFPLQNGTELRPNVEVAKYSAEQTLCNKLQTTPTDDDKPAPAVVPATPVGRSFADVLKSRSNSAEKTRTVKVVLENDPKQEKKISKNAESEALLLKEDKLALTLGKHLYNLDLTLQPTLLQPRGFVNKRNWCYINATLQALIACPPFYLLLKNLPLGGDADRGKSSTPIIDSMVKLVNEFLQLEDVQEDLKVGQAFHPDFIYDMLRDLKSDCLKGQQEDAEEFLSFILNGMHEEIVRVIKHYEKTNCINSADDELRQNGDVSEGEDEWQVIGSKHKGIVTRKVAEHKTPISDLLGGQIKSVLITSGSRTSACVQPFFTLQLDIQNENVTTVLEALNQMTLKDPIQGYTCAKTKQEIEAYTHLSLQKLPPILILHLKRFVYNKNGGCKKVMKKTDYPLQLELKKDLFSPDIKRSQRQRYYKLFAVMYHNGEEAVKGHYVSDIYNHGSGNWVRCDDSNLSPVTEAQVLSYSPPRVPYLLFYQECSPESPNIESAEISRTVTR